MSEKISQLGWETLEARVAECTACSIAMTPKVFGEGKRDASLVLVGEGPGRNEAEQGRPFIGPAGDVLREALAKVGIDAEEVFITNVIRCRPTVANKKRENRAPEPEEINNCSGFLLRTLDLVKPKVVVALGLVATRAVLYKMGDVTGESRKKRVQLGELRKRAKRGEEFMSSWGPVIVTYHPSFVLRSRSTELDFELRKDLRRAKKLAGL